MDKRGRTALLVALAAALVGTAAPALADRGAIRTVAKVDLEEPAQRAIIAYDGTRELLILQTDVKASQATRIVEFMPLPAKPTVSLAPEGCFAALQEIVKKHNLRYVQRSTGGRGPRAEGPEEAVTVVVAAQLGPHGVTVVEVKDAAAFVEWVNDFFKKNELGEPALSEDLREIVADYLGRGLRFFAFDIVTLTPEKKTVQPLVYDFASDRLYYPLKVTNLYGGTGTIELLMVVPRFVYPTAGTIAPAPGTAQTQPLANWRCLRSTRAEVAPEDLTRLHPAIPALMGDEAGQLSALKYEGPLRFADDFFLAVKPTNSGPGISWAFLKALERNDASTLESLLVDVPFAFDRKGVITDRQELTKRLATLLEETKGRRFRIAGVSYVPTRDLDQFEREFFVKHLEGQPGITGFAVSVTLAEEKDKATFLLKYTQNRYFVVGFSD